MKFVLCPDALLRLDREGSWVLFNPRARRHFELDVAGLQALVAAAPGRTQDEWAAALAGTRGWHRSRFSNADGLMADPTAFGPREGEPLGGEVLFEALREDRLLQQEDGEDYRAFLAPLNSILDSEHLGTFHQLVGRFQVLDLRRKDKWRWWHDQKFTPDGRELKHGLYRWVQGHFFDRYFGTAGLKGARLLDFGCGNGYYSRRFHELGARVTGVDTSPELLKIARGNHPGLEFIECVEATVDVTLRELPASGFDAIYLSDVLLFFFLDPKTHARRSEPLARLLEEFGRLLSPGGRLFIMEPNATFWLAPWLGDPARPFTVVTEHREAVYRVAPTHEEVITVLGASGFAVTGLHHPEVAPFEPGMDAMAHGFAKAFPIWDFYACRKL